MTFVFYDTETTGTDTNYDQILQFAAIHTDDDLNELERYEARCRLDPHVVPSAGAFRVTGMTIDRVTDPALPSHYEMVRELRERLSHWCPTRFVGWNSMWFDERLLRQAFYKCLHPPYLTNTDGNERSDIMKLAQCVEAFASDVLVIPTDDRGKPTYKLDRLAPANGFPHLNAHDAMGDVEATIHICRLVKERAPGAWGHLLHCASKSRATAVMVENPVFLLRDSYFGKLYQYALTLVGDEGEGSSAVLAFDLSIDPGQLANLSDDLLAARLERRPKPLRRVKPNEAPFVSISEEGEGFAGLEYLTLVERADAIQSDQQLRERLIRLHSREGFEPSEHVEEQIYGGFPSPADAARMSRFHATPWCDRFAIVEDFDDPRYRYLGRRLILAHCPESLPDDVRREEERLLAARLTGHGLDSPPWLTLTAADDEAAQMEAEGHPDHAEMLGGFRAHIAHLLRRAADVLG